MPKTLLSNSSYTQPIHYAIADSGCTATYISSNTPHVNAQNCDPLRVTLPDGKHITSTKKGELCFPHLPSDVKQAHIFPDIKNKALLSLGTFCDNGYTVELTKDRINIISKTNNYFNLYGHRDHSTGLWMIKTVQDQQPASAGYEHGDASSSLQAPPPPPTHPLGPAPIIPRLVPGSANNVYALRKQRDIVCFLHKAAFSPCKSTWIAAIRKGFFISWPGLTPEVVAKSLPDSEATLKGHMRQTRMNVRSTKEKNEEQLEDQLEMTSPKGERENLTTFKVLPLTAKVFSDQIGRFPMTSSLGSKYVLILHDADTNSILAEPLKSRAQEELLDKQIKMHTYLIDRGHRPQTQILDNECPNKLKQYFEQNKIHFQLVPPHLHRTNVAERAIATFKDHLLAGIASTDPSFPLHLWDRLIPQAVLTLNLLRSARYNPRLSAWHALNGAFDYNSTPLAPPGTKVQVFESPTTRKTWAPHSSNGFYIGPAMQHYRCYKCYIPATRGERIARTVHFLPHDQHLPSLSAADIISNAALEITSALQDPQPPSLLPPIPLQQVEALRKLSEIFNHALPIDNTAQTRAIEGANGTQTRVCDETTHTQCAKRSKSTTHTQANNFKNTKQTWRFGTPNPEETSRCGTGAVRHAGAPRGGVRLPPELRSRSPLTAAPRPRHERAPPRVRHTIAPNSTHNSHPAHTSNAHHDRVVHRIPLEEQRDGRSAYAPHSPSLDRVEHTNLEQSSPPHPALEVHTHAPRQFTACDTIGRRFKTNEGAHVWCAECDGDGLEDNTRYLRSSSPILPAIDETKPACSAC